MIQPVLAYGLAYLLLLLKVTWYEMKNYKHFHNIYLSRKQELLL